MKVFIKPCAGRYQILNEKSKQYLGKIVDVISCNDIYQSEIYWYWSPRSCIKLDTPELLEQYIKLLKEINK